MISLIRLQAFLVCLVLWLILSNAWFSFILFLVFIGGLIVLFIYVSSLASNEKISLDNPWKPSTVTLPLIIITIITIIFFNNQILKESSLNTGMGIVYKIYSPNIISITSLTILYLLLTLIIIVKIITLKEGPIRGLK